MQINEMTALVEKWANINSFSHHREGLKLLLEKISEAFARLNPDEMCKLPFANGEGLFLKKRPSAPLQVYFGGHIDTVFPPDHPFQKVTYIDDQTLRGPGVSDMKGGLVVMLAAIDMFEQSPEADQIGWEIFLNPDEEIGSPYSTPFIQECSKRCDIALLFEPPLPDGSFASERKGSVNYIARASGKAAHAGREKGVNAILILTHFINEIEALGVNIGLIKGGTAANIVPDRAECLLNLRTLEIAPLEKKLEEIARKHHIKLEQLSSRPPKQFDKKTEELFYTLKRCGEKLNIPIKWRETGGVCDGNTFGAAGVPTIDTLGVTGGGAHTDQEFIRLESLPEKAKLVTLLLNDYRRSRLSIS